jgi:hypothetical protein
MKNMLRYTLWRVKSRVLRSLYINRFVSEKYPFKEPAILILSYPRSGSSWIGQILSTSEDVAYLYEPITRPYLEAEGEYALVDIENDGTAYDAYRSLGDKAFAGNPVALPVVVQNVRPFSFSERRKRRLMLKEVNPKAAKFYSNRYNLDTLLIVRHPAAVALSFYQRGWLNSPDTSRETGNRNSSDWEEFGYAFGTIMRNAIEVISKKKGSLVITYERLALNPYHEFEHLFRHFSVAVPIDYKGVIDHFCYSSKPLTNAGQIERNSESMVYKWKKELAPEEISDLRRGYQLSGLDMYSSDQDWRI